MEVHLSADQQAFVRQAVASGRLQDEEEAVHQAFALWEERERRRMEILAGLDSAELDMASGRYSDYTDEMLPQLGMELKRAARALRDAGTEG
jgi:Arc/MetJ-type ribon-helix-helix transcriptional regulator